MFASLVGTDHGDTEHRKLFERLCKFAVEQGFAQAEGVVPIRPDGSLDGWSLEQKGPHAKESADFFLSVTAPRVPGISPIYPVFKTIGGPLFAVVVLPSAFVVSREDRRDIAETQDAEQVVRSFSQFLDGVRKAVGSQ